MADIEVVPGLAPRSSRGLTARVLTVLVLPLTLLVAGAGLTAARADQRLDALQDFSDDLRAYGALQELRVAVAAEHLQSYLHEWMAGESNPALARTLLASVEGISVGEARTRVDQALLRAPAVPMFDHDALERTRRTYDDGERAQALNSHYQRHSSDVQALLDERVPALLARGARLGDESVVSGFDDLSLRVEQFLARTEQVRDLLAVWFAAPFEAEPARLELAASTERVRASAAAHGVSEELAFGRFDRLVEASLLGHIRPTVDEGIERAELARAMELGFDGRVEAREAVDRSFEAVVGTVEEAESRLQSDVTRAVGLAVAALGLCVLAGAHQARAVTRAFRSRDDLEARLFQLATVDPLTGAATRGPVVATLDRWFAAGPTGLVAALFIDLDGFKSVNDRMGHPAGDEVLRVAAERIQAVVGSRGLVSRIGGDEFLVVIESAGSVERAVELGRRLQEALAEVMTVAGHEVQVGASIGVASSDHAESPEALLRAADLAVYAAKSSDRAVVAYTAEFDATVQAVRATETALRTGIASPEQFELVFQPIVGCTDGRVSEIEALVRWDRPGVGAMSPEDFIPVAERSRLIIGLDRWVLREALAQVQMLEEMVDRRGLRVSVNASAMTVAQPDFPRDVQDALRQSGCTPGQLVIEITETALVTDISRIARHLTQLRALGVKVAIDDFGTGYTSLTHLRSLPVDVLKIDRSMLAEPPRSEASLLPVVFDLARRFGLETVAEGVEDHDIVVDLQALGCDRAQGFAIARPMSLDDLAVWMRETSPQAATTA